MTASAQTTTAQRPAERLRIALTDRPVVVLSVVFLAFYLGTAAVDPSLAGRPPCSQIPSGVVRPHFGVGVGPNHMSAHGGHFVASARRFGST